MSEISMLSLALNDEGGLAFVLFLLVTSFRTLQVDFILDLTFSNFLT